MIDPHADFPAGYDVEKMITEDFMSRPKNGKAPKATGNGDTGERFVKSRVKRNKN